MPIDRHIPVADALLIGRGYFVMIYFYRFFKTSLLQICTFAIYSTWCLHSVSTSQ